MTDSGVGEVVTHVECARMTGMSINGVNVLILLILAVSAHSGPSTTSTQAESVILAKGERS